MQMVPFFFISYDGDGLQLQQVKNLTNSSAETAHGKTMALKVMREKEPNVFESFEFQTLSPDSLSGFDVMALRDIDKPLWDVYGFFKAHAKDLILG